MREALEHEMLVCRDLGRKAADDTRRAIMAVLDLADMAAGPSAVASVALTAAASAVDGLACIIAGMLAIETSGGRELQPGDGVAGPDDFLLASLFVVAARRVSNADMARDVPRMAADMFRLITSREPRIPVIFSESRGAS